MKKVLIHIGSPKTGTTSIQNYLNTTTGLSILYPNLGEYHHNCLSVIYQPYKCWPRIYKSKYCDLSNNELSNVRRTLKKQFFSSLVDNENLVLSGESLFNFKKEELLKLQSDLLRNGFTDFLILAYVREPAKYYLSMMQQGIKASAIIQNPSQYRYKIQSRINIFEEIFPNKVVIKAFVKENLVNNNVVDDFVKVCNDFFNVNLQVDLAVNESNKSMSAEELIILQKYRRVIHPTENNFFKKDSNLIRVKLDELIEKNGLKLTKPCLKNEVTNIINRNHEEDLAFLKETYAVDFFLSTNDIDDDIPIFDESDFSCILQSVDYTMVDYIIYSLLKDLIYVSEQLNPHTN